MNSFPTIYLKKILLEVSCPIDREWVKGLAAEGVEVKTAQPPGHEQASGAAQAGVLWMTDSPDLAREHLGRKEPVLAVRHAGNAGEFFSGVRYVCENMEELDLVYLDRVYRRYAKIPWDILETRRCFLRETTVEDVDAFYEIYAEPSVTEYMENLFPDRAQEIAYTEDYIRNIYDFYGFGLWSVCLKETGQVIGRAGLSYREGFEDPELGFVIGVPWQRRGIAEEVCRAVLAFGREELELKRALAFVEPENRISVRLLEKLGFGEVKEGLQCFNMLKYSVALSKIV